MFEDTVGRFFFLFVFCPLCVCSVMGGCEYVYVQSMSFNMGEMSGGRIQESDSCRKEAVPVPGGLSPEAPVAPPRGQEGEESVCWVTGVFDDFPGPSQTPLPIDVLYGRKWCSSDALGGFHHPLQRLPVRGRAAPVPDCYTVGQDALNGTAVEVHQDV